MKTPIYNTSKKIIILSGIYPDSLKEKFLEEGASLDFAAQTFERSVINGFVKHDVNFTIVTAPFVRFAKKTDSLIKGYKFKSVGGKQEDDIYIGNLNIPFLRLFYEFFVIRKYLKHLLKKHKDSSILIFSLHSPFLLAYYSLVFFQKKSSVVVYDLPQFMSSSKSWLYRFAKNIDQKLIKLCLKKIDSYVLLSSYMADCLPVKGKKIAIVEGIYDASDSIDKVSCGDIKLILYTGSISERYGVFDLIEAFTRIPNDDYRLCLCGNCTNMNLMNQYLHKDSRISFLGLVDKSKVYALQAKATLLVNPRHSCDEYTKYSFPSKTMEYLASGTPTVMCKLPAIPDEYMEYLFIFDDESVDGYAKKIIEICSKDKDTLLAFGKKASQFIKSQKNEIVQTTKILDLLYS